MKYTTLNLNNFVATEENVIKVDNLMQKFGYAVRFNSIDSDLEIANANYEKSLASAKALETKEAQSKDKGIGSFTKGVEFTQKDAVAMSNAYTRCANLAERIKQLHKERYTVLYTIYLWTNETIPTDIEDETLVSVAIENVKAFAEEFSKLHKIDQRTIEILSSVAFGVKLFMPTSMRGRLEMYYNFEVSGQKGTNPYFKEVKEELQNFLRSYSPIYNDNGTSEGLFEPKNMNINSKEVDLFIASYFSGSKIDRKTGLIVGNYKSEKSVVGELNMLMLAKLQGMKYGYAEEKKNK